MSDKNIIFVDKAEYAEKAIQYSGKLDNCLIIALNSMVMWQLEKFGQAFKTPYDYYDYNELLEINEHLYVTIETIFQYMDEKVLENVSFFKAKRFKPSRSLYYLLKTALNTLCFHNIHIQKVLEYEKPHKVYYFAPSRKKILSHNHFDADEMNAWSELMYANLSKKNIDFSVFKGIKEYKKTTKSEFRNCMQQSKILLKKPIRKAQYSLEKVLKLFEKSNTNLTLLIYQNAFSVSILSEEIKRRKLAKIIEFNKVRRKTFHDSVLREDIDKFWDILSNDDNFQRLFSFKDINLFPILNQYIGHLVTKYFILVAEYMAVIESLLKRERIDVLLTPLLADPDEWIFGKVCKHFGIPVITWQHGNYAMFKPHSLPVFIDIRDADHWFAFGNGTKNAYVDAGKTWNTNIVAVGSCELEKIRLNRQNSGRQEIKSSKKRTVIVPLRYFRERIVSETVMYAPPSLYWQEIKERILLFSKFNEMEFILKLFPNMKDEESNHIIDFVKHKNINNIKFVKTSSTFADLLSKGNLVLIDWPYTVLLQSISADKQIICINKYWRMLPEVESLIKKRCYIAGGIDKLKSLLTSYSKDALPGLDNDEFICEFGICKNDGKAWQRAFNSILKICANRLNRPESFD